MPFTEFGKQSILQEDIHITAHAFGNEDDASDDEVVLRNPTRNQVDRLLSDLVVASREIIEERTPISRVLDAEGAHEHFETASPRCPVHEQTRADSEVSALDSRFFGSLRSIGKTHGFIACWQIKEEYGCDVYIAKIELPNEAWCVAQPVSFAVILTDCGQPEARDVQTELKLPRQARFDNEVPPVRNQSEPSLAMAPPWLESLAKSTKNQIDRFTPMATSVLSTPKALPVLAGPWADLIDEDEDGGYGSTFEAKVKPKEGQRENAPLVTSGKSSQLEPPMARMMAPSEGTQSPVSDLGKSPEFCFSMAPPIFTEDEEDDELGEWGRRKHILPGSLEFWDPSAVGGPRTPSPTWSPLAFSCPQSQYCSSTQMQQEQQETKQQDNHQYTVFPIDTSETTHEQSDLYPGGLSKHTTQSNSAERDTKHYGWDSLSGEVEARVSEHVLVGLSLSTPPARQHRQWVGIDDPEEIDHERKAMSQQSACQAPLQPHASGSPKRHLPETAYNDQLLLPEALWSRTDIVRALCFRRPRQFLFSIEAELTRLLQAPEGAVLRLPALAPHYHRLLQKMCKRFRVKEEVDGMQTLVSTTATSLAPLLPLAAFVPRSWAGQDPSSWQDRFCDWCSTCGKSSLTPCPGLKIPPGCDFSDFGPGTMGDDVRNLQGFGSSCNAFSQQELQQLQDHHDRLQLLPGQWRFMETPSSDDDDGIVVTFSLDSRFIGGGVGVVLCDQSRAAQQPLQRLLNGFHSEQNQSGVKQGSFFVLLVQPSCREPAELGLTHWCLRLGSGVQAMDGQWIDSRTVAYQDQQQSVPGSRSSSSSTFWFAIYPARTKHPETLGSPDDGMLVEAGLGRFPWGRVFRTRVQNRSSIPLRTPALAALGRDQITHLHAVTIESGICPDRASRDHVVKLATSSDRGTMAEPLPRWLQQSQHGVVAMLGGLAVCESLEAAALLHRKATQNVAGAGIWTAHTLAHDSIEEAFFSAPGKTGVLRHRRRAQAVKLLGRQMAMELALDDWFAIEAEIPEPLATPIKSCKKPTLPAPPTSAPPPPPTRQQQQQQQQDGHRLQQPQHQLPHQDQQLQQQQYKRQQHAPIPMPLGSSTTTSSRAAQLPQSCCSQAQRPAAQWLGSDQRLPHKSAKEPLWQILQPPKNHQQRPPSEQVLECTQQSCVGVSAKRWLQSHPPASFADAVTKQRQFSASLPAVKSQVRVSTAIRNSLHCTGDPGVASSEMNCWSKSNRKCTPDQSRDRTRQRGQLATMDISSLGFSAAASALVPGVNVGRGPSGDTNHQRAFTERPMASEMNGLNRWAYSEEMGWHQSDSSTYVGSFQGRHQIDRMQKQATELSSHALPFMPGEGVAAAAASRVVANAHYSVPNACGKNSSGFDCQNGGSWGSAGEVNWTNQPRKQSTTRSDDVGLWKGVSKSSCDSWHTDAGVWEDGTQHLGKGWNSLCKSLERIPWEGTTKMKSQEIRQKGKRNENPSNADWWSGIPLGSDSMHNGRNKEAAGENSGWEGNDGNSRNHDGWDTAYLGKGWGSSSTRWSSNGWDSKGRGAIMSQSSRGVSSTDWHAGMGHEGIVWTDKGSDIWTGNSKRRGKSRTNDWLEAYEDAKWTDPLQWEEQRNNQLQGSWKDEWRSEWRGLEDVGKGHDCRRAGNLRQPGEWRHEQHQGRTLRAKLPRDQIRHIAQHIASKTEHGRSSRQLGGDEEVVEKKPQLCCLTATLDLQEDSSFAAGVLSKHNQLDRKNSEESMIHVRRNSPAPSVITVSETDSDEESRVPTMGATGTRNAKGQGKTRSVGDEAATRSKLRRMWQQQREAERRKTRSRGHYSQDDDEQRSTTVTLD
eukprot:TRINITY_DN5097_c0_g1_i3.p1 TRINITY_DN5097_c0_g1~~TRINITY_DN5097_c0_g1_i3.p1  ORF type:complete len:1829 (-),score=310.82 TRINITY_DN5097_c0_g1_i3:410-5896(-)